MDEVKTCPITGKECFPWKCMWGAIKNDDAIKWSCGLLLVIGCNGDYKVSGVFVGSKEEECESAS